MNKKEISSICEELYRECLIEIPQYENNEIIWILNGSTICNILYNVIKIEGIEVSEEFNQACYNFIRKPKGDIDITYKADRKYKFDFNNPKIKKYQEISKEKRTYNFIDHNSIITENDLLECCLMETRNGLKFIAKKPQYLFLYKFKELLAVFKEELLLRDIDTIKAKNINIFDDVLNLYNIALSYCDIKEINEVLSNLPNISETLKVLYDNDRDTFNKLLNVTLDILNGSTNIIYRRNS